MTTISAPNRSYVALALAVLVTLLVLNSDHLQAQAGPVKPASARKGDSTPVGLAPAATPATESSGEKRIQLDLDAVPLHITVQQLAESFPEVNIVMPSNLNNVPVTVRLRSVTLAQALRAITLATEGRVQFTQEEENLYAASSGGENNALRANCRVFSLANYLAGKDADVAIKELHEALQLAMELLRTANRGDSSDAPRLELHGPTKLLIVVGNIEQLEVVTQVVAALENNPVIASGLTPFGLPGTQPGIGAPAAGQYFPAGPTPKPGPGKAKF